MSDIEPTGQASSDHPEVSAPRRMLSDSVWFKDFPLAGVLILTVLGVAYTSYSKRPVVLYWDLLAPLIALVCVATGWRSARERDTRWHLMQTQALHWFAFLVVMNVMLLPNVQNILGVTSDGLAMLTLLALGTFTAGVHVGSLRISLLGLVMVLGVPAIAWVEESAAILVLIGALTITICAIVWWHSRKEAR